MNVFPSATEKQPTQAQNPQPGEPLDYSSDIKDVDSLLGELREPRQDFPGAEPSFNQQQEHQASFEDNAQKFTDNPQMAKEAARSWVNTIDGGAKVGLGLYAKNMKKLEEYGASKEEKETLEEAWLPFVKEAGTKIPPWVNLLLSNLMVYGPKAHLAHVHKTMKRVEHRQDQMAEQNRELAERVRRMEEQQRKQQKQDDNFETVESYESKNTQESNVSEE